MTARSAAALLFGSDDPTPAEVEKARRRPEAAVERRELVVSTPGTSRHPTTYATIRSRSAHAPHANSSSRAHPSLEEGVRELKTVHEPGGAS